MAPFSRGGNTSVRRGAGLGLAISKAIVEAHGGVIRAEPGREREVFESFARGQGQGQSLRKGAGLGLAISKAIVEAHGGAIRAERGREKGAKFVVTLPLAA